MRSQPARLLLGTALALAALLPAPSLSAQSKTTSSPAKNAVAKAPKLVVGIVIDQMRWDYLNRFYPLFSPAGGFRRMLDQGFSCDNTQISYTPTVTACGHTGIYTGSVPAIHGITGNAWYDNQLKRTVYCSEDKSTNGVGAAGASDGQMSPKNMLVTTISDELRLATNFKSKVIGIALKDRGAILPAGHSANGAYWFDSKSGNFITSTYYRNALPEWATAFNNRHLPDSLMALGWPKSLDDATYLQYATADAKAYESTPFGKEQTQMPYALTRGANEGYAKLSTTPHGNTLTLEMALAAIEAEQLGADAITDLLAVSFSSPDYVGHSFGPNSWELVDNYVQLDKTLGRLFDVLDKKLGKGNYLSFLSADHAVAHVPGFMKENHLPGGTVNDGRVMAALNAGIKEKFGVENAVVSMFNYQVSFNNDKIDSLKANKKDITAYVVQEMKKQEGVLNAFPTAEILTSPIPQLLREKLANGYLPQRCGDVQIILKSGYIDGGATGTTHGLWYAYDSHIPLLWYGWRIPQGRSAQLVNMADIAPTLAALLGIQEPSGNVGKPISVLVR